MGRGAAGEHGEAGTEGRVNAGQQAQSVLGTGCDSDEPRMTARFLADGGVLVTFTATRKGTKFREMK